MHPLLRSQVMNFIVAATFLSLQDLVGKPGAFWLYGSVAVLGVVWLCLTMPETSGRSLEQIEEIFRGRRASAQAVSAQTASAQPEVRFT